jgi:hypothetical protein
MADHTVKSRRKSKSAAPERRTERYILIAGSLVASVLFGAALSYEFGKGLRPAPTRPANGIGVGRIEVLRLPTHQRQLADIKTFEVAMGGADDYGRVFVNNQLVINTENPAQIFFGGVDDQTKRRTVERLAIDRSDLIVGKSDVRGFLKRGKNFIVVELENSILGSCVTNIDIIVNGIELESFPQMLPEAFAVEPEAANQTLLGELKRIERTPASNELTEDEINSYSTSEKNELTVSSLEDAICARRVFELDSE